MSGDLVVRSLTEVEQADHLTELARWAETAGDGDALSDRAEKARVAQRLIKAANAARSIQAAAFRLEATCLRRLAQIGEARRAGAHYTSCAEWLAQMSDSEFGEFVRSASGTVLAMYRREMKRESDERERWARMQNDANRAMPTAGWCKYDAEEVRRAAATLLDNFDSGDSFSINAFVDQLAEVLDVGTYDSLVGEGLREAARQAMREASLHDDGVQATYNIKDAPAYLTIREDELGWVRVPFYQASIDDLRWFVDFRRQQAEQMAAVVRRLEGVLAQIEAGLERVPNATTIAEVVRRAPKKQAA